MVPPAKRRKRNVLVSSSPEGSEYEDGAFDVQPSKSIIELISSSPAPVKDVSRLSPKLENTASTTPTKAKAKAKTANHPHNAAPIYLPQRPHKNTAVPRSASSSPAKTRSKDKVDDGRNRNLFTMFSNQAKKQAAAPKPILSTPDSAAATYEDDISDEDEVDIKAAVSKSFVGTAARKRAREAPPSDNNAVSSSQKFKRDAPLPTPMLQTETDTRPWAERFSPVNLEELAVHKKKVSDVRQWLETVMAGRTRQRLLVLKGPAGSGKTVTVQLLAKAIGAEVLEWRNPIGSVSSSDGFISMAAQFEEFIGRGGKFGQLNIVSEDMGTAESSDNIPLDRRKSMILVEEFPNTFQRSSDALHSFRAAILGYLAANVPPLSMMYESSHREDSAIPVIMVISETLLTTSTASADSFTAHRLLGAEILQHPGVEVIDFNPVAPTFLSKALELVVQKESRKSGRRKTPGPKVLECLVEVGDIRSAIASLEFLCLRGDDNADWSAKVSFSKVKKASKDTPMTSMERKSLELITRREASLGIFHAVGKVVYNKRDSPSTSNMVEQLPEWLEERARPKKSQVNVDTLIDETGTDTQTFIAALHENYILSCEASPSDSNDFSDLDHINGCLDALSIADLLCPSWDGSFNSSGFGGRNGGRGSGGDILRQDEMCFQLAVRGILFALPYPVNRKAKPGVPNGNKFGKRSNPHTMSYPASLQLWRAKEEIESVIDMWVARMLRGDDTTSSSFSSRAAAFAKPKSGSIESWNVPSASNTRFEAQTQQQAPTAAEESTPSMIGSGTSAKKEMLLEWLPYMTMIAKAKKGGTSPLIREMEKVTTFTGIEGPGNEEEAQVDQETTGGAVESWATDKPGDADEKTRTKNLKKVGFKRSRNGGLGTGMAALQDQFNEQKLVLSDDDIEDF